MQHFKNEFSEVRTEVPCLKGILNWSFPGRMALLVTLFLVLINIFNSINNASPNVEGMTAISAWMLACMFFIFGALLGYACILYFLLVTIALPHQSPVCVAQVLHHWTKMIS